MLHRICSLFVVQVELAIEGLLKVLYRWDSGRRLPSRQLCGETRALVERLLSWLLCMTPRWSSFPNPSPINLVPHCSSWSLYNDAGIAFLGGIYHPEGEGGLVQHRPFPLAFDFQAGLEVR